MKEFVRYQFLPLKKGIGSSKFFFFAAIYSAFGKYDVVHIHAEGPAFFCWIPKIFGKR